MHVHGVGVGVPTLRVATADIAAGWDRAGRRGQVAVCAPDEDVLTLSWAAATMALAEAGIDAADVDGLWWGTTRPPFAEGPSHAVLADALGLGAGAAGCITSGSTHAGMDALFAAADAVAAGSARTALVIAADALRPGLGTGYEARCGAGAVAMVLRADAGPAAIGARASFARPFLDRYRGDGETDTRDVYDGRLFREEVFVPIVTEAARQLATAAGDAGGTAPGARAQRAGVELPGGRFPTPTVASPAPSPARSVPTRRPWRQPVPTPRSATPAPRPRYWASSAPSARRALPMPVGYGGGRASGVAITVTAPVPGVAAAQRALEDAGRPATYAALLRARNQLTPSGETIPMGVPPESAMFTRGADEMLQLLGGRCVDCGTISTPPSIHPHCIACGGPKLEPVALAREGTVHTYVVNHTMPAPFEAPLPIAVIDLDDGARIMLQVADDGTNVEIGRRMRLVLRRYAHERGVPVYGYKALPVKESEGHNS